MTAMPITAPAGTRVRPRRTVRSNVVRESRRVRAGADPRHARVVVPVGSGGQSCRLERPRPRVTITETSVLVPPRAPGWQLTERGWAVVVLGTLLAFAGGSALLITQFLAVTAG